MDSKRRKLSGGDDLVEEKGVEENLRASLFLFLQLFRDPPTAQEVFYLEECLALGVPSRATSTLHALALENRPLLQALRTVTCLHPSAQSPSPSLPGLSLRLLCPETAWADVAPLLGERVTETSCIMSWDDVADSYRTIIKTHYSQQNILLLQLAREHLPALHCPSLSPGSPFPPPTPAIPLANIYAQWTKVAYLFCKSSTSSSSLSTATPSVSVARRKEEWLGPLSVYAQWLFLVRAVLPTEHNHPSTSVEVIHFCFAMREFMSGHKEEEEEDGSEMSVGVTLLNSAANHATSVLLKPEQPPFPHLSSSLLPLHCVLVHLWKQQSGTRQPAPSQLQRFCMTKALVTLLNVTSWENSSQLFTYEFWKNVKKAADKLLFSASSPLSQLSKEDHHWADSLPQGDAPTATSAADITPLFCFLWFRSQFHTAARLWDLVEKHSLLEFVYDVVIQQCVSLSPVDINPPLIMPLATAVSDVLKKLLPRLLLDVGVSAEECEGVSVSSCMHLSPVLCALLFHLKLKRKPKPKPPTNLEQGEVMTLLEQIICQHLCLFSNGKEAEVSTRLHSVVEAWLAVSQACKSREHTSGFRAVAECFAQWKYLYQNKACDLSRLPSPLCKLFFSALTRLRHFSSGESQLLSSETEAEMVMCTKLYDENTFEAHYGSKSGGAESSEGTDRRRMCGYLRSVVLQLEAKLMQLYNEGYLQGQTQTRGHESSTCTTPHENSMTEETKSFFSLLQRSHDEQELQLDHGFSSCSSARKILQLECLKFLSGISYCHQLVDREILRTVRNLYVMDHDLHCPADDSREALTVSEEITSVFFERGAQLAKETFIKIEQTIKCDLELNLQMNHTGSLLKQAQEASLSPTSTKTYPSELDGKGSKGVLASYQVWRQVLVAAEEHCIHPWTADDKESLLSSMVTLTKSRPTRGQEGASHGMFNPVHFCKSATVSEWEAVAWGCRGSRSPLECFLMATLLQDYAPDSQSYSQDTTCVPHSELELTVAQLETLWSSPQDQRLRLLFSMLLCGGYLRDTEEHIEKKYDQKAVFPLTGNLLRVLVGGGHVAVACLARWFTCLRFENPSHEYLSAVLIRGVEGEREEEQDVSGMLLDLLMVRQQLNFPPLSVALLWVFFTFFFRKSRRDPHLSYLLWHKGFQSATASAPTFTHHETQMILSAYLKSKSRDLLWENLRVCVARLQQMYETQTASQHQSSVLLRPLKTIEEYMYQLLLTTIQIQHSGCQIPPASKVTFSSSTSSSSLQFQSVSNKRPRQLLEEGKEEEKVEEEDEKEEEEEEGGIMQAGEELAAAESVPTVLSWSFLPLSHWLLIWRCLQQFFSNINSSTITSPCINSQPDLMTMWQTQTGETLTEGEDTRMWTRGHSEAVVRLMRLQGYRDTDLARYNDDVCCEAVRMMVAARSTVKAWQWKPCEDEVIYLCWEMASSAKSLFFLAEDCHQHFVELISSLTATESLSSTEKSEGKEAEEHKAADLMGDCSSFRSHLHSMSLIFLSELKRSAHVSTVGAGATDDDNNGGCDGTNSTAPPLCPYLHFFRLQQLLLQCNSTTIDISAPEWSEADIARLEKGLEHYKRRKGEGSGTSGLDLHEVAMWLQISQTHLSRRHSPAACYCQVMHSPSLFLQYYSETCLWPRLAEFYLCCALLYACRAVSSCGEQWQGGAEEDDRVALLHCMLQITTQDELQSVGSEHDMYLSHHQQSDQTLQAEEEGQNEAELRRARVMSQATACLSTGGSRGWFQCGLRWNGHVSRREQQRVSMETKWSQEEVARLSNSLTVNHQVAPSGAYSVTHWESVAATFSGMHNGGLAVVGKAPCLPSLKILSAGVGEGARLGNVSPASFTLLAPFTDTPTESLLGKGDEHCEEGVVSVPLRKPAECFKQSQKLIKTLFRSFELKRAIHYIGLTKTDLILSLSPAKNDLFWKSLVKNCRLKLITAVECKAIWKKLVQVNSSHFQSKWTDLMRQRLRELVTWFESDASSFSSTSSSSSVSSDTGRGGRVLSPLGVVQDPQASTRRDIQRHFDWTSVAEQLSRDESFSRTGEWKIAYLDCFRQWHSVEYVPAVGIGHSHLGVWEPFEDEMLEGCCQDILEEQKTSQQQQLLQQHQWQLQKLHHHQHQEQRQLKHQHWQLRQEMQQQHNQLQQQQLLELLRQKHLHPQHQQLLKQQLQKQHQLEHQQQRHKQQQQQQHQQHQHEQQHQQMLIKHFEEQKQLLQQLQQLHREPSQDTIIPPEGWEFVSTYMENVRTPMQCMSRWKQLQRKKASCSWTNDEENSLIVMTGRYQAQGKGVNWAEVAEKLTQYGSPKTKQQCQDYFLTCLWPRLQQCSKIQGKGQQKGLDSKSDSLMLMEGNKALARSRNSLKKQGVPMRGMSDAYVLQHVDWISLGQMMNLSALQAKKRYLHLLSTASSNRNKNKRPKVMDAKMRR